jgi:RHS repeat-associated protein
MLLPGDLRHLLTSTTAAGRRTVTTLDSLGRVAQVQMPGALPLQVQYDSHGRPLSVTQGSRVYSYAYDSLGNLASVTDPLGRQASVAYDLAGRPTRQVLPDGRAVTLAYDASGNVTSVTPPGRPAHSFGYTPVDLEQSYSPPSLGFPSATLTSYNLDKQVSLISRPAGDTVAPSYDSAGRVASVTTSWGTTSLSYSPTTGQLAQITAPDLGKLSYAYDGALLTDMSWSGSVSGSIHRTYDNFLRVASETVSGGQAISYQYDTDGLLLSAGALALQRDPATGFVTGSALGPTAESRTYDAYGAEASYTASLGGSNLYSVTYTRDALGRIASKAERFGSEPSHTFSYSYDVAGRLSDVSKDGTPTAHYAYDANGNRLTGPGLTSSPAYDAQDRLLSYGPCRYTYKGDGSLQTKTCGDGTTLYDYDAFGNLRHVTLSSGTNIDYVIDGRNRRIGKKVNGALVEGFLYRSRLQPVAWLDSTGAVKAQFIYGSRTNVPEYMVKGANTYRFVTDQVGSVRLVVDVATGQVAERIDYDEFGNVLFDTAPSFQPFGFSGGLSDQQTAFIRLGVRDYDPAVGRWTTKDPELFAARAFNLYEYANSDAINRIDPTGFASITADPNGNPRCEELLQKILDVRNELAERAQELREDPQGLQWDHWTVPHPKYGSVKGHQEAFVNKQRQVRRLLEEWNDSDCRDGPRGLPADAWDLATMRAPQPIPRPRPDPALLEAAAATGAAAATAGYLSTFLRVLPVLLPILAP